MPPGGPDQKIQDMDPRLRIQIVNADSGAEGAQMDAAIDRVQEATRFNPNHGRLRRLASIPRMIWRSAITGDHIQHRGFRDARRQVRQNGGDYVTTLKGGTGDDHQSEMSALVDRFSDDLLDQGETNTALNPVLLDKLRYAIKEYAAIDSPDDNDGMEALQSQVEQFLEEHGPRMTSFGHNIYDVAKTARQARMHGEAMARIENAMSGRYGVARAGERTRHQRGIADALTRQRFINETTAGGALIAGLIAGKMTVKTTVNMATRAATFGAAGGLFAGIRTWQELGRRRQQYLRQTEAGGSRENPGDSRHLDRLQRTKYDVVHASTLIVALDEAMKDIDYNSPENLSKALDKALDVIAEVQARRDISNTLHIGLIQYSSGATIERERTLLYKRLNEAIDTMQRVFDNLNSARPNPARRGPRVHTPESDIENIHGNPNDPAIRRATPNRGPLTMSYTVGQARSMVESRMHARRTGGRPSIWDELLMDVNEKNRQFRRQRLGRTALIGSVAFATGGLAGFGIAEAAEHAMGGIHQVLPPGLHEELLSKKTGVDVTHNLHMVTRGGHHQLVDSHGDIIVNNLQFKPNGAAAAASIHEAQSHGILVKPGFHAYRDSLGHLHRTHMTEFWGPTDYETLHLEPGALPLYFLRGNERMRRGEKWDRLEQYSTDFSTERQARTYLRSLDPKTRKMVEDMAGQLSDPSDVNRRAENPKAVIVIPADASKDANHILRLLEQYRNQEGVDYKEDFEIVICVAKRSQRDTEMIRRVRGYLQKNGKKPRSAYRNMRIRLVEQVIPPERRNSRYVRDAITGAVIEDLMSRGLNLDEVALIYNGADNRRIDPHYIETVLREMGLSGTEDDSILPVDFLAGRTGRLIGPDPSQNPRFQQQTQRISRMLERYMISRPGYMGSTRANFALRPSAYVTPQRRRIQPGRIAYSAEVGQMVR